MATPGELSFKSDIILHFLHRIDRQNLFHLYQELIVPHQENLKQHSDIIEEYAFTYLQKISIYSTEPEAFVAQSEYFLDTIKTSGAYSKIIFQLWSFPPSEILKFIEELNEERLTEMIKHSEFESRFTYVIGNSEDLQPIYFLYDEVENDRQKIVFDTFLKVPLVTNGDNKIFSQDYHLSWPVLFHLYFPEKKIIITSDKDSIPGKYIYVLTFDYFQKFIKSQDSGKRNLPPVRQDVLHDAQNNRAVILWNDCHESTDYKPLFDWWSNCLKEQNLIESSFIFSGDVSNQLKFDQAKRQTLLNRILKKENTVSELNFYTIRYFEEAVKAIIHFQYQDYSFQKRYEQLKGNPDRIKHFLCFNRIIKDYRVILSFLFFKNNLLPFSNISQKAFKDQSDYQFGHNTNTSLNQLVDYISFEKFIESLPWTVDTDEFATNHWNTLPVDIFEQSFVWVTTETDFGTDGPQIKSFITEKTYKPIAFFVPFIIVGPPFTLQTLKDEGYRTFSKWWDESYDSEPDPLKRMKKIEKLLIEISKLSIERLLEITSEMQEVLQHNHSHLMQNRRCQKELESILVNYYK